MKFQSALFLLACSSVHGRRNGDGKGGGIFGGLFDPEFVTKTCDAEFECNLRNEEVGTFICRETFHVVTGDSQTKAKCIPNDKALATDYCGCCGEDCPVQPQFKSLACEDQDIEISRNANSPFLQRKGGHGGGGLGGSGLGGQGGGRRPGGDFGSGRLPNDAIVVCRELHNPFTGELELVTIAINPEKSLEGDVCGCCGGSCPDEIGERAFERPQETELDWCAADQITTCTIPRRRQDGEDTTEDGVFVCRSMFNMLTGYSENRPICIPTYGAWSTDECGCCGEDCPQKPERVDPECTDPVDSCERRNGEDGVFVCRSLFHPLDRTPVERTLCITDNNAWTSDDCGCCDSDCPVTPEGGFADESVQMLELALEDPNVINEFNTNDIPSGAFSNNLLISNGLLLIAAFLGL